VTVTTWRYSIPSVNGEGWAILFLDSTGSFTAISDWGDYSHHWRRIGWGSLGSDFREVSLGFGDSYIQDKISGDDVYDGEATLVRVKQEIVRRRRDGECDAEWAREQWDAAVDSSLHHGIVEFWLWETELEERHEFLVYRKDPGAAAFVKNALPRLREKIREDLAREAHGAAANEPAVSEAVLAARGHLESALVIGRTHATAKGHVDGCTGDACECALGALRSIRALVDLAKAELAKERTP
jgi:hypothetical protein